VLYLDSSGVRSLRARNSSNAASVSDIGSPIDSLLRTLLTENPTDFAEAVSTVEQGTGRWWLRAGSCIYVLSHFPGPKVTAWSCYTPEDGVQDMVSHNLGVAVRDDSDVIRLYGGENYDEYDDTPVIVTTPFMAAGLPATEKAWDGIDIAGRNVWKVEYNLNPSSPDSIDDETQWRLSGYYDGTTNALGVMGLDGTSTHIALRLTCEKTGQAQLANSILHYAEGVSG